MFFTPFLCMVLKMNKKVHAGYRLPLLELLPFFPLLLTSSNEFCLYQPAVKIHESE